MNCTKFGNYDHLDVIKQNTLFYFWSKCSGWIWFFKWIVPCNWTDSNITFFWFFCHGIVILLFPFEYYHNDYCMTSLDRFLVIVYRCTLQLVVQMFHRFYMSRCFLQFYIVTVFCEWWIRWSWTMCNSMLSVFFSETMTMMHLTPRTIELHEIRSHGVKLWHYSFFFRFFFFFWQWWELPKFVFFFWKIKWTTLVYVTRWENCIWFFKQISCRL